MSTVTIKETPPNERFLYDLNITGSIDDAPVFYLQGLFSIVASILHLGNITFSESDGSVWVNNPTEIQHVSNVSDTSLPKFLLL